MGRHSGKYDIKASHRSIATESGGAVAVAGLMPMLPIEQDFYSQFESRVFSIGFESSTVPSDLRSHVERLWHAYCFAPGEVADILHPGYVGTFGEGGRPEGRDLAAIHAAFGHQTRTTNLVRLNLLSASAIDHTAVVIYEYYWDFLDPNAGHVNEIGQVHETWVQESGGWRLLTDSGGPFD